MMRRVLFGLHQKELRAAYNTMIESCYWRFERMELLKRAIHSMSQASVRMALTTWMAYASEHQKQQKRVRRGLAAIILREAGPPTILGVPWLRSSRSRVRHDRIDTAV